MPRKHLSRLARVRLFDRHHGVCCICGLKIHAERGERWEPHHIKPLWAGGADVEYNMAPAHATPCHAELSANDNGARAKADRQRANHLGIERAVKSKLPGGRDSPKVKTLVGRMIERFTQAEKHRVVMRKRGIGMVES